MPVTACCWTSCSPPMRPLAKRCHAWLFGRLEPLVEMFLEHLHQWSQPSNPTATCAQRVALSLALQTQYQN